MSDGNWRAAVVVAAVIAASSVSGARGATWQTGSGDWFTVSNWSGGVPTSGVTALISNGGTAQITTTGATASALELGVSSGQQGAVSLGAGGALTAGTQYVGMSGSGTFTQLDGTNTLAVMYLGYGAGSSGTYLLEGGTLSGRTIYVGLRGTGTFTQSGGMETGSLSLGGIGSAGSYALQAGVLSARSVQVTTSASTFTQTGGTLSVGQFTESAGTVSVPSLVLGTQQNAANYTLSGGTLNSPTVTVQAGGTFSMTGGFLGCTTFTINGGTARFPTAILDSGAAVVSVPAPGGVAPPTINFTSGTLGAANVYLGFSSGSFSYAQRAAGLGFDATTLYVGYASG
ncbi:MAG: hypothetical protein ACTHN5_01740 [Phycisphaerae bacterium]